MDGKLRKSFFLLVLLFFLSIYSLFLLIGIFLQPFQEGMERLMMLTKIQVRLGAFDWCLVL
jgi:hypothetical protein